MSERVLVAARSALCVVGLLFVLSASVGAITLKPTEWAVFLSGGLWLGLPAVAATIAYKEWGA